MRLIRMPQPLPWDMYFRKDSRVVITSYLKIIFGLSSPAYVFRFLFGVVYGPINCFWWMFVLDAYNL